MLGAKICRVSRLGGVARRRRVGQRERGRRQGQIRALRMDRIRRINGPVITVQRSDDLHERRDRGQFAPVEPDVGHAQRLGEARDLQMNEAIGRVEPTLRDRALDLALDGPHAHLPGVGDLRDAPAGCESLEGVFAQSGLHRPPFLCGLSRIAAFGTGFGVVGQGRVPSRSGQSPLLRERDHQQNYSVD